MKKILYSAIIIFALANCNTPNKVIANPDSSTNTSGSSGSANITNTNKATSTDVRTPAGTPQDSSTIKKDSIPH